MLGQNWNRFGQGASQIIIGEINGDKEEIWSKKAKKHGRQIKILNNKKIITSKAVILNSTEPEV